MPLGLHTVVYQSFPFWINVLARIFNNERIFLQDYLAIALSFGGIAMIVLNKEQAEGQNDYANTLTLGLILSFVASWTEAAGSVMTRKLSVLSWEVILFYQLCASFFAYFFFLLAKCFVHGITVHTCQIYGLILLNTVFDFSALVCRVNAF